MKKLISNIINFISRFLKVNNKKIVFESGRNLVDGNPKALYKYIKNNHQNEYKTIFLVSKGTDISMLDKKDVAYYKTIKAYYHQATAKFWVKSQSIGGLLKKKKNQIYIQTWHGVALKKMGYDIEEAKQRLPMEHVKEWDYFIASDIRDEETMRTATGFNKQALVLGMARTDEVLKLKDDSEFIKTVKNKLNIKENSKKVILYCPTFREEDLVNDKVEIKITSLSKVEDAIILLRLHPQIRGKVNKDLFKNKNIINACEYPDIQDLLIISDILITDYSSVVFDFAILNRPMIMYPYDLEKYIKERNGFYLDYKKDIPAPIVYNEEELYNTVKNIDNIFENYKEKMNQFNEKYNKLNDGQASKRLLEKMNELI